MGNNTSQNVNPYIFFPITSLSIREKIENVLGQDDLSATDFTFRGSQIAKLLDTTPQFIETYGEQPHTETSGVRVVMVCKDKNGCNANYDNFVNGTRSFFRGGNYDDDSSDESTSSTSDIFTKSESSDSDASSSSSSEEKHKKHKKSNDTSTVDQAMKKLKGDTETPSEGGSFHSYSLPTINSSDIRNMADNELLTTNSIMEEAVNNYNKLHRSINMGTSERDLLSDTDAISDSSEYHHGKITKNNKYD